MPCQPQQVEASRDRLVPTSREVPRTAPRSDRSWESRVPAADGEHAGAGSETIQLPEKEAFVHPGVAVFALPRWHRELFTDDALAGSPQSCPSSATASWLYAGSHPHPVLGNQWHSDGARADQDDF